MKLDVAARRSCLCIFGKSSTGKTTFAFRYLVARKDLACRLIFDPDGEAAQRFGLVAATSESELDLSLDDGFTIYDPHAMFPGKLDEACDWFCGWAFDRCAQIPGKKVLGIDEAWRYCPPGKIPDNLANCLQTGRKVGLSMMFLAQRPNRLNEALTNEATETVCFRLQGENALRRVADLGLDPAEVSALPYGSFVSVTDSDREIRGRLW